MKILPDVFGRKAPAAAGAKRCAILHAYSVHTHAFSIPTPALSGSGSRDKTAIRLLSAGLRRHPLQNPNRIQLPHQYSKNFWERKQILLLSGHIPGKNIGNVYRTNTGVMRL